MGKNKSLSGVAYDKRPNTHCVFLVSVLSTNEYANIVIGRVTFSS